MANANPYLVLRRTRDSVIKQLRQLFAPSANTFVSPAFKYPYLESSSNGNVLFYGNPSNGNTLVIGVNIITFVSGSPSGLQVHIEVTQQGTSANLVILINANSSILKVSATTNSIPNQVTLTATVAGSIGDAITLAVSSTVLAVSSPTLLNGGLWDFDHSKIFIGDAIPQQYAALPMLCVDTCVAREDRYLGPEDLSQAKNSFNVVTADKIFTSLVATVNINLYTIDDTIARDEVLDVIYNNISTIRDQLAVDGIEMIRRTFPTESRVMQDNRWYITNHFTLELYLEWTDDLLPISTVSGIGINVPLTGPVPVITSPALYEWSGLPFNVITVVNPTHLIINDTTGMTAGDTIIQGIYTTTITTVTDGTHLVVGNTTGWVTGVAVDNHTSVPFNYQIAAIGATSYSSSALPTGLSLNASTGLVSGVPLVSGSFYVTLGAVNANGTGNLSLTILIP
jgi:hypothetical protein